MDGLIELNLQNAEMQRISRKSTKGVDRLHTTLELRMHRLRAGVVHSQHPPPPPPTPLHLAVQVSPWLSLLVGERKGGRSDTEGAGGREGGGVAGEPARVHVNIGNTSSRKRNATQSRHETTSTSVEWNAKECMTLRFRGALKR